MYLMNKIFILLFFLITISCQNLEYQKVSRYDNNYNKRKNSKEYNDSNIYNINSKNYTGYYKIGNPYTVNGKTYYPKEYKQYNKVGLASWYGDNFHNKKTANGEIFNMYEMTAAHKTLPLPSIVRVTNLENGRSIVVKVNDRGPFVDNRIIDLSKEAAIILGFKNKGFAKIRVELLKKETKEFLKKYDLK